MVFGVQIKKLIGYYRMSQIKGCIDFRAFLINHINHDSSFLSQVHITVFPRQLHFHFKWQSKNQIILQIQKGKVLISKSECMFNSRTHLTKKNSKEMIVGKERMKELVLKGKLYLFWNNTCKGYNYSHKSENVNSSIEILFNVLLLLEEHVKYSEYLKKNFYDQIWNISIISYTLTTKSQVLEEDEECGCQCAGISARHCAGHFNEVGNANSAWAEYCPTFTC